MGLTGIIIKAAIKLRPIKTSWIKQKTLVAKNIDQTIEIFENNMNATYSVAWINSTKTKDNIGQSLIMLGEHASIEDLDKKNIKNHLEIKSKKNKMIKKKIDRIIIKKNVIVLSSNNSEYRTKSATLCLGNLGIIELLLEIDKSSVSSFLSVLNRFGDQESNFSFPMKGYTIALDFPVSKETFDLLEKLDDITLKYEGRFYLAKDARMKKEIFKKSDKRIQDFINYRNKNNYHEDFKSSQSSRLEL